MTVLRRFWTGVALVALLCGFSAAPYTHAHHAIDSVSDERHPHGETLVHAHASPYAHHDTGHSPERHGSEDNDEQMWWVSSFVSQQPAPTHAPFPLLLAFAEPHVQLNSIAVGSDRLQPMAHGPPVGSPSGLRAPPAFLPAFA